MQKQTNNLAAANRGLLEGCVHETIWYLLLSILKQSYNRFNNSFLAARITIHYAVDAVTPSKTVEALELPMLVR